MVRGPNCVKQQLAGDWSESWPIPYPPIGRHGVIGDRQSAALVAADGTINWLCLPHYGADVAFGALLDHERGGFWRLGPACRAMGIQTYRDDTFTLLTKWQDADFELELADTMAARGASLGQSGTGRFLIRRLACRRGRSPCSLLFYPKRNFEPVPIKLIESNRASARTDRWRLELWCSRTAWQSQEPAARFELEAGDEFWTLLTIDAPEIEMSVPRAAELQQRSDAYWRDWSGTVEPRDQPKLRRSAAMIHLLSYAPAGSIVAAPTSSLPERIGGDWNADYRMSWVRDTSLALGMLARIGKHEDGTHYLHWLSQLGSSTPAPLQVVYGVEGQTDLSPVQRNDLFGYRHSQPVRFGNHAYKQHQHDSLGYLADCALGHLQSGGEWQPEFWELVRRLADFVSKTWKHPGNSIWELPVVQHYLSGKIMSWVALDRAIKIADRLGQSISGANWPSTRDEIRADILENGWSERLRAFRQRYEAENLDAAALLISVMGVLPADDPRVISTLEQIDRRLTINGFVYRFDPHETPKMNGAPLGQYEGAFLPCTFWLATGFANAGRFDKARAILENAERVAGPLGIFAEGVDARSRTFLGNTPLVFSHTEYLRAVLELAGPQSATASNC